MFIIKKTHRVKRIFFNNVIIKCYKKINFCNVTSCKEKMFLYKLMLKITEINFSFTFAQFLFENLSNCYLN